MMALLSPEEPELGASAASVKAIGPAMDAPIETAFSSETNCPCMILRFGQKSFAIFNAPCSARSWSLSVKT